MNYRLCGRTKMIKRRKNAMKMQVKVMSLITVCALLSMALFAFGCTGTTGKNDGSGGAVE